MKRPMFLTVWLVIMALGGIFSLYSYTVGSAAIMLALPNFPSWAIPVYALLGVVNLTAVAMLWMWKKMGFYLIIASAVIIASLNGMILGVAGIGSSVFAVIGIGILYLAMKPAWQNFK